MSLRCPSLSVTAYPQYRFTRRMAGLAALPLLVPALLVGCSSTPRPVMPSLLEVRVVASPDANADARGRGTPILVRIYELRSPDVFERADFFALNDKDQAVLSDDLLHREEFLLQPGQTRVVTRKTSNDTRAIGVMAAYRAIDTSTWHATASVEAPLEGGRVFAGRARQLSYLVEVGRQGVSVQPQAVQSLPSGISSLPTPRMPSVSLPTINKPSVSFP